MAPVSVSAAFDRGGIAGWLARHSPWAIDALWISFGRLYFARLVGQGVGMALTILSARMLHPEGRGDFVAISTGSALGVQALNLGLSSSLVVLFSRRPLRIGRYRRHLVVLAVAWASLSMAGVALASSIGQGVVAYWWPAWALWVPLQLLGLYQGAALLALQDSKALVRIELLGRCAGLLLGAAALMAFSSALPPFLAAVIAADALVAALGAIHLARASRGRVIGVRRAVPFFGVALRMGLRAYAPLVLLFLLVKSDILVLRALRGAAETGVYSVASQFVDIALILPASIGALLLPSVVRASSPTAEMLRVLRPAALLIGGMALGMLVFGHWAIVLLFGRAFEGAYPALLLLLPGFVCLALLSLLGQYFASRGFPFFLSLYWLLGFATNLSLNLLLIPRFGFLAAAASSSVAYALVFGLLLRRFLQDRAREAAR
jgi:O-antigen/teichoic acid export membrane protein